MNLDKIKIIQYCTDTIGDAYEKAVPSEVSLTNFLNLYFEDDYFHAIYILSSKYLKNRNKFLHYEIKSKDEFMEYKDDILRSCYSDGHMSVIFSLKNSREFFYKFFQSKQDFVKQIESKLIDFKSFPLDGKEKSDFLSLINQQLTEKISLVSFTHDAQWMCIFEGTGEGDSPRIGDRALYQ